MALRLALTCAALALTSAATAAPTMLPIPAGSFLMGYSKTPLPASLLNPPPKAGKPPAKSIFPMGDADESPAHRVTVNATQPPLCVSLKKRSRCAHPELPDKNQKLAATL